MGERGSEVKSVCRSCGREFILPRLAADPAFYNCCSPCLLNFPTEDDPPCPPAREPRLNGPGSVVSSSSSHPTAADCLREPQENHPAQPATGSDLLPGLVHDVQRLALLFSRTHARCVPVTVHESLNLRLPPEQLVNLGVVVERTIGRWDRVWEPGRVLWREL
jgi:hypothetical protein